MVDLSVPVDEKPTSICCGQFTFTTIVILIVIVTTINLIINIIVIITMVIITMKMRWEATQW